MGKKGLKIRKSGDTLTISIDEKSLSVAMRVYIETMHDPELGRYKINSQLLIHDVISAITEEEEDGTTLVHKMFDSAFDFILVQGLESVEEPKQEE